MSAPTQFFDVAQTLLDCVCAQMDLIAADDATYPGCPCDPYVSAGEPMIDCCTTDCTGGGMLTVHVEDAFPSDNFPLPISTFQPCKAATWVAVLVVTLSRCTRDTDELGQPDIPVIQEAARLLAIDQYAALTALGCCLVNDGVGSKAKRRVQMTDARALTSEGGCASKEIRAFVEVGPVCSCTPAGS